MTLRVTFQMVSERSTWSETHYLLGSSDPSDFGAQTEVADLAVARANLLGVGAELFGARISLVGSPRTFQRVRYQPGLTGTWPGASDNVWTADFRNTAVLVDAQLGGGRHSRIYLAGVPDCVVATDPAFPDSIIPIPAWINAFNHFSQALRVPAGVWGDQYKTNPASQPGGTPITNAAFPSMVGIPVAAPLARPGGGGAGNIGQGDRLQLRGWKRTNMAGQDLNGTWQVAGVLALTGAAVAYFLQDSSRVDPLNFWRLGLVQTIDHAFSPYTFLDAEKVAGRKRGGSIELPRGRSRNRRSRGL